MDKNNVFLFKIKCILHATVETIGGGSGGIGGGCGPHQFFQIFN
jgi:hypothetical protein